MDSKLLLSDSGYGVTKYLIPPLLQTVTNAERLLNESQIRTRNPIERCFGVSKRRFQILFLHMRVSLETTQAIIVSTAILHNIAILECEEVPPIDPELIYNHNNLEYLDADPFIVKNIRNDNTRHSLINNHLICKLYINKKHPIVFIIIINYKLLIKLLIFFFCLTQFLLKNCSFCNLNSSDSCFVCNLCSCFVFSNCKITSSIFF